MKAGDVVRVKGYDGRYKGPSTYIWHEFVGKFGMIVGVGKRLHIPAAKVFIDGVVAEFDLDELDKLNEANVSKV